MPSWIDGGPGDRGDGGRRVLRPLRRFWLLGLGLASVAGCGGARGGIEQSNAPSGGRVITADDIAASGAKTAWDAVRLTVPNVQLRENRGRPTRIQRRGRAGNFLHDPGSVMVGKVRVHAIRVLEQVEASVSLPIQVLSGVGATTYYRGTPT